MEDSTTTRHVREREWNTAACSFAALDGFERILVVGYLFFAGREIQLLDVLLEARGKVCEMHIGRLFLDLWLDGRLKHFR